MIFFKRNQKRVAERLRGNLDYYNHRRPWRTWRWWVSGLSLMAGVAAVPAFYYLRGPESVMNPGPISRGHAAIANNCAACHPQTNLIQADSQQAGKIVRLEYFVPIDQACGQCHQGYFLHQPNVAPDLTRPVGTGARNETSSCTSCHREHVTSGKMLPTTDQNCAACHNQADLMAASSQFGRTISSRNFPNDMPKSGGGLTYFYKPRPPEGYTTTFAAFDQGHPEFQIHAKHLKDIDTLQYNHARHELPDIKLNGRSLDCQYCHKPDATGTNFQKLTFENNCITCHALRFDPNLVPPDTTSTDPGLVIPHGNAEKARAFLSDLRYQYYQYARQHKEATTLPAEQFPDRAVQELAKTYGVQPGDLGKLAETLEFKVFYNKEHLTTGAGALRRREQGGGGRGQDGTYFPGCAFCHQVSGRVPGVAPIVTKPILFDRWLGDGRFDHAKHQQQTCAECHSSIHKSERTSDINLPTQQSCTQCHNSKPNGVANECQSCHGYHNDPARRTVNRTDAPPLKALDPKLIAAFPGPPATLREMFHVQASGSAH